MQHSCFFVCFWKKDGLEAFTNSTPLYSLIQETGCALRAAQAGIFFPALFYKVGNGLDAGREEGVKTRNRGKEGTRAGQRSRPRPRLGWSCTAHTPWARVTRRARATRVPRRPAAPPPPPRASARAARWPGPGAARRGGGGCSERPCAPASLCASLARPAAFLCRLPGRALGAPGEGGDGAVCAGAPGALQLAARPAAAALPSRLAPFPSFRNSPSLGSRPPFPVRLTAWARLPASPCEPNPRLVSPGSSRPPSITSLPAGPALGFYCLFFLSDRSANPTPLTSSLTLSGAPGRLSPSRSDFKVWGTEL